MGFISNLLGKIFGGKPKAQEVPAPAAPPKTAPTPAAAKPAPAKPPSPPPKAKEAAPPPKSPPPALPKAPPKKPEPPPVIKPAAAPPEPQGLSTATPTPMTALMPGDEEEIEPPTPKPAQTRAPAAVSERRVEGLNETLAKNPAHKKAMRMARGMISDLEAYYQDRVDEAVKKNNFNESFKEELEELRERYEKVVPADVRGEFNHFEAAINDLIKRRKSQA